MTSRLFRPLALGCALVAAGTIVAPGIATAQWTGSDYCAVQNTKGDWALVGGASCNPTPSSNPNASWTQALILDFDAHTITNAYDTDEVEHFDNLYDMLTDLSANHASEGWMYVANQKGNDDYVYLMVNEASCAGNSEWAVAPVCDMDDMDESSHGNAAAHAGHHDSDDHADEADAMRSARPAMVKSYNR
ncbi:MAG: hypothetical protein ACKOA2_06610 [Ilumatobacteraceae bacterium]